MTDAMRLSGFPARAVAGTAVLSHLITYQYSRLKLLSFAFAVV